MTKHNYMMYKTWLNDWIFLINFFLGVYDCIKPDLNKNKKERWYLCSCAWNTFSSIITNWKSSSIDGKLWTSELWANGDVTWHTLCTVASVRPAFTTAGGVMLATKALKMVFSWRLRCSMCKSHGIFHPTRPLVLMHLDHSSWAAFHFDRYLLCIIRLTAFA